jgi:pimeloyl-ACP methyl ester carboxylesterase
LTEAISVNCQPATPYQQLMIVLIHGLARTKLSMIPIAIAAKLRGHRVINWHYPSRSRTIAEHVDAFAREVAPRIHDARRVHFITHSLGGIIVRQFLATHPLPNLGRVVMLAPPNRGSEVADVIGRRPLLRLMMGKPGRELGTSPASVPNRLPAATFPLGVIAGTRTANPLFSTWIAGPNDGKVSVGRASCDGMHELLVVARTHTFMPWAPDVIARAMRFVESGSF